MAPDEFFYQSISVKNRYSKYKFFNYNWNRYFDISNLYGCFYIISMFALFPFLKIYLLLNCINSNNSTSSFVYIFKISKLMKEDFQSIK